MSLAEKIRPLIRDYLPASPTKEGWFRPEHICDGLLLRALNKAVGTCCPRIAGDLPKTRVSMKEYEDKVKQLAQAGDEG